MSLLATRVSSAIDAAATKQSNYPLDHKLTSTQATTLTITNCPCTIVKPVTTSA